MLARSLSGPLAAALAVSLPLALPAQPALGDGFLFGSPRASLVLRTGYARPTAGSDVFSFVREHLTIDRNGFSASTFSGEVAVRATPRVAFVFGVGASARSVHSEYRDWVDNNDLPIEQSTLLRRVPITVGVRYHLAPPGRSLSRLAWVPTRYVPYVAAGVGRTYYLFKQTGDFVDYQTLDVFYTEMKSSGWAPSAYAAAGFDYAMSARLGLVTELRYDASRAPLSNDFRGFDRIDLSGLAATAGLAIRF
jgi:hypothetical protein